MSDKPDSEKEPVEDAFDKDSYETVNLITQLRIYDLLLVIARGINESEAVEVAKLHAEGKVLGPPPSWNMADDSNTE
jgi:hypothetical protein